LDAVEDGGAEPEPNSLRSGDRIYGSIARGNLSLVADLIFLPFGMA
jgi:hypothetical protein